jgi:hypothetical protein
VLFGARDQGQISAILAAVTTIAIGVEKSLLFRERWKAHLRIVTQLTNLQIGVQLSHINLKEAAAELGKILNLYAETLPIEARETTQP